MTVTSTAFLIDILDSGLASIIGLRHWLMRNLSNQFLVNSPLHVGFSLRSALKGTLSGSLSVTLADESWKSPLIEDKKYN